MLVWQWTFWSVLMLAWSKIWPEAYFLLVLVKTAAGEIFLRSPSRFLCSVSAQVAATWTSLSTQSKNAQFIKVSENHVLDEIQTTFSGNVLQFACRTTWLYMIKSGISVDQQTCRGNLCSMCSYTVLTLLTSGKASSGPGLGPRQQNKSAWTDPKHASPKSLVPLSLPLFLTHVTNVLCSSLFCAGLRGWIQMSGATLEGENGISSCMHSLGLLGLFHPIRIHLSILQATSEVDGWCRACADFDTAQTLRPVTKIFRVEATSTSLRLEGFKAEVIRC